MLESLITSKTRIKLLLKFFLNSNNSAHLRGLESEFGESTNGIRVELNRFEQAGLLNSHLEGNRKIYAANINHPLFSDIQQLVHKHLGLDLVVEQVIQKIGELERIYLTGAFAKGQESQQIEILLIGGEIDKDYLETVIQKASKLSKKQVLLRHFDRQHFEDVIRLTDREKLLLLWQKNK